MVDEHKCYRKGGRRLLEDPFFDGNEINVDYNIRAKQFGAFAALRGFEEMLEEVKEEVEREYDK